MYLIKMAKISLYIPNTNQSIIFTLLLIIFECHLLCKDLGQKSELNARCSGCAPEKEEKYVHRTSKSVMISFTSSWLVLLISQPSLVR